MNTRRWLVLIALLSLGLSGCGGGGGDSGSSANDPPPAGGGGVGGGDTYDDGGDSGDDSGGDTGGSGGSGGSGGGSDFADIGPMDPTLSSIQDNVFTPICTECHEGTSAPRGLRLEEGMSYGMLVNVASDEVPTLDRVEPGDPDNSYIIHKLEGTQSVGARMPRNGPYLEQADIDIIRQWIADGATDDTIVNIDNVAKLSAAWPMDDSRVDAGLSRLVVVADRELDTTRLHDESVRFRSLDTGESLSVNLRVTSLNPTTFVLQSESPLPSGAYALEVAGDGFMAVTTIGGEPIDGDNDGVPGGNFRFVFDIKE